MKTRILVSIAVILCIGLSGLGIAEQSVNASGALPPTFIINPTFIKFATPTPTPRLKIIGTFIRVTLIIQPPGATNTPLPTNTNLPPTNTLPGPTQTPIVVTATFQQVPTKRIVFATWTPTSPTTNCPRPVIVYSSTSGANTHIKAYFTVSGTFKDLTPAIAGNAIHPRITPDGNYVFYTLQSGDNNVPFLVPLCGGEPQKITDKGGEAVWTSNGLVLVIGDEVYIINLFDPNPFLKDLGISCHEPDASPDGTLIACVGPNNQILIASTNPGVALYKLPISGHNPRWKPDGKGLVYSALLKGDQLLDFGTGNSNAVSSDPNLIISDLVYNPSAINQIAMVTKIGIEIITTDNSLPPKTITQEGETGLSPDWWTGNHVLVGMTQANSYLSQFKQ